MGLVQKVEAIRTHMNFINFLCSSNKYGVVIKSGDNYIPTSTFNNLGNYYLEQRFSINYDDPTDHNFKNLHSLLSDLTRGLSFETYLGILKMVDTTIESKYGEKILIQRIGLRWLYNRLVWWGVH